MQAQTSASQPISFLSVEAAWFHAVRAVQAGAPAPAASVADIMKCLDTLYRQRRIDLIHARILRIWGLRGVSPNPGRMRERSDWRIWREAMDRLEGPLRARGIVTGAMLQDVGD